MGFGAVKCLLGSHACLSQINWLSQISKIAVWPSFRYDLQFKDSTTDEKCSIVSAGSRPLFGCVTPVFAVEKGPLVNDVTQI